MQEAQFELHAAIEQRHWWFVGRRQIVRGLVAALLPHPGATVLDVGCGTGANAAGIAAQVRCEAIDTSLDAITLARRAFPQVPFHLGDVLDPAFAMPPDLAVVLLMDVLEHIENDRGFLAGLVERLPTGAHLLLTVPANPALWSKHDEAFGHHRRYTTDSLAEVWDGLPVRARLLSPYCASLYPAVWAVRRALQPFSFAFGESDTDFRMPPAPLNEGLRALFAREQGRLLRLLAGRGRPYPFGSSLIAVLRKEGGA